MRIIIYAMGQVFEKYRHIIKWEHIIAIADKKAQVEQTAEGCPVIKPVEINSLSFDYIAIFSNRLFETIRNELIGEYFIPQEKIVSWLDVVEREPGNIVFSSPVYEFGYKKILDIGMNKLPKSYLSKQEFLGEVDGLLDGVLSEEAIECENLYDHVYKRIADSPMHYDAVLIWNPFSVSENEISKLKEKANGIMFYTSYLYGVQSAWKEIKKIWSRYGICTYYSNEKGIFWMICFNKQQILTKAEIYVVTHKRYNVRSDNLYRPLCVGEYRQEGFLSEHDGENIAYLNKKINECTALYWIWKNTDVSYIGLCHYRRYFYNNKWESIDNYLDAVHIEQIMKKYDLILSATHPADARNIYQGIYDSIDGELCKKAHLLLRSKMQLYQPKYLASFDNVMAGYNMFCCNLFVAKREILNQYCEWLFSFLIPAAEEIDISGYDSYSQRVMGFFAERMWTVWLKKNKVRIKQLPYVIPEF